MSNRPNPMDEGSAREIWDLFFAPLVYYKPENVYLKDWYWILFHLDSRTIEQYSSTEEFTMPGLFWQAPHVKTQGLGYRHIKKGQEIIVRHDSIDNQYDIEFFGGPGEATQVFTLTHQEYKTIERKLVEMKGNVKRNHRRRLNAESN